MNPGYGLCTGATADREKGQTASCYPKGLKQKLNKKRSGSLKPPRFSLYSLTFPPRRSCRYASGRWLPARSSRRTTCLCRHRRWRKRFSQSCLSGAYLHMRPASPASHRRQPIWKDPVHPPSRRDASCLSGNTSPEQHPWPPVHRSPPKR